MEIELDTLIERPEGQLLFVGSPRQYRSDCQAGQFKIGSTKMMGKSLKMQLIAARVIEDELFGYDYQKWVNIIFVDPEGIVSGILFKTESMDNFFELYRQSLADGDSLIGKSITANMSKRASRATGTGYFAVEFEINGEGTYTDSIQAFKAATNMGDLYRINSNGSESPALPKA